MAKRYIIEEIRATHWSARVRDAESGEVTEVPLEGGGRWPGRLRSDLVNHEPADAGTNGEDAAPPPESAAAACSPASARAPSRSCTRAATPTPCSSSGTTGDTTGSDAAPPRI